MSGRWHYVFPWLALRRVRLHVGNPPLSHYVGSLRGYDAGWDAGYDRAMYDVGRAIGVDRR